VPSLARGRPPEGERSPGASGGRSAELADRACPTQDLFNARVKAQHPVHASEAALREQNQELHRYLNDMLAERDEYKQAADALARALNVPTTQNDELRRRASRARVHRATTTRLVTTSAGCRLGPHAAGLTSPAESSVYRRSHSAVKPSRT
jgi:hypothetical protein